MSRVGDDDADPASRMKSWVAPARSFCGPGVSPSKVDEQNQRAHHLARAEEASMGSFVGESRATVAGLEGEIGCGYEGNGKAHHAGFPVLGDSTFGGTGQYQSLQQLLMGFTSGALCVVSNQGGPVLQDLSCFNTSSYAGQTSVQNCSATFEHDATNLSLQQDYLETEEQIVNVNSSDQSSDPGSNADKDETDNEIQNTCGNAGSDADGEATDEEELARPCGYPENVIGPEGDVDNVDWERLLTTGELVAKNASVQEKPNANIQNANADNTEPDNQKPWKKRRREKIPEGRKNSRKPRGMGAVERSMRRYCEKKEGHMFQPYVGLEFDSEAEAFEFYNLYSWEVGFGIRKGNVDYNKTGYIKDKVLK